MNAHDDYNLSLERCDAYTRVTNAIYKAILIIVFGGLGLAFLVGQLVQNPGATYIVGFLCMACLFSTLLWQKIAFKRIDERYDVARAILEGGK